MITRGNITYKSMGLVMMDHGYRAGRYRTLIIVKVDDDSDNRLSIVVLCRRSFIYSMCACEFNGMFPSFIKLTISREAHLYWILLGDHVSEKGIMMDLKFTGAK